MLWKWRNRPKCSDVGAGERSLASSSRSGKRSDRLLAGGLTTASGDGVDCRFSRSSDSLRSGPSLANPRAHRSIADIRNRSDTMSHVSLRKGLLQIKVLIQSIFPYILRSLETKFGRSHESKPCTMDVHCDRRIGRGLPFGVLARRARSER